MIIVKCLEYNEHAWEIKWFTMVAFLMGFQWHFAKFSCCHYVWNNKDTKAHYHKVRLATADRVCRGEQRQVWTIGGPLKGCHKGAEKHAKVWVLWAVTKLKPMGRWLKLVTWVNGFLILIFINSKRKHKCVFLEEQELGHKHDWVRIFIYQIS